LDENAADQRTGTQTIERAAMLLREVSAGGHSGVALSDLASRCGLRKSTVHRILMCLVRERLVKQRPDDRHYLLGPLLFELGLSANPDRGELQHAARSKLTQLAKETSGVAFLYFRSGDHFVCAVRVGTARLEAKGLTIFPGTRRPLLLAAGGVAMLLGLPKEEAAEVMDRNFAELSEYSDASVDGIRQMLKRSFAEGFASNAGEILPRANGFGYPLLDRLGMPFAAIAVGIPERTFPFEHRAEIRERLQVTAKGLQAASA
jgi:DNA-binding IclR family transcriptional regulator